MTRPFALAADGARLVGVGSVVVALISFDGIAVAVFALVLLGLVLARVISLTPGLDLAVGASVLVAGWSSVLGLYEAIGWWDLAVHLLCTGAIAALAVAVSARTLGMPPPPGSPGWRTGVVVLATTAGLALSVLWEMGEWAGHTYLDSSINVGYADTLSDLAAGGLGAAVAGAVIAARGSLPVRARPRPPVRAEARSTGS
ncbi:hypothetical protein [Georgenia wangjunii]|uniref:hypothetical protein n=1 Tax=Georgenia wangjunii TaxID=3117730 RepID=UPI002F261071